jgi:hypothetical protein|tara:strand:+ start:1324 stop:1509 length:186 start_codon:yes stop_codon:yes gene_type:complete
MDKKESKKEEVIETKKEKVVEALVKVSRLNPKDGERYPMEVKKSEVLAHQNGDYGLGDIVL